MIFNKVQELKAQGLRIGFTASQFDMLHAGHIAMLSEAKNHCENTPGRISHCSSATI